MTLALSIIGLTWAIIYYFDGGKVWRERRRAKKDPFRKW